MLLHPHNQMYTQISCPKKTHTFFVPLPHPRTVCSPHPPSWLAGRRSCTVWPGSSSAGSAVDSLCSTGAPWPAAQCTRTRCAEVCGETEGGQQGQRDYNTAPQTEKCLPLLYVLKSLGYNYHVARFLTVHWIVYCNRASPVWKQTGGCLVPGVTDSHAASNI